MSGEPDGRFGVGTEASVRQLNSRLGYPDKHLCFEPESVVAVPEGASVESVDVAPGDPWRGGGDWLVLEPTIEDVVVTLKSTLTPPDGKYRLVMSGQEFAASVVDGLITVDDPQSLGTLSAHSAQDELTGSLQSVEAVSMQFVPATALVVDGSAYCVAIVEESEVRMHRVMRLPTGVRDVVALAPDIALEGKAILAVPSARDSLGPCPS